jgi:hypothetical protein
VTPERQAIVRADIVRRLRTVCADLPEEEFLRLVEQMVARQLKYEITS